MNQALYAHMNNKRKMKKKKKRLHLTEQVHDRYGGGKERGKSHASSDSICS
jgi:hypothetical protein